MTKINRLVMHGFKSFAKHTELVFGPKFNVILGPNGSGKSNVLDSLCFVLGKTSAKSMRAEKSSNLIYNGGKSKKPAKQGEVSIYFDNVNKTFPTEEKEVKITRIVRQTGQSVYKINDNIRTREQILDLLNIAKINPDAYNIILQGDIVKFVEMSPNDRRVLIEDISGISVYEEKKHKALLELEKVEKKLNDADIVLKERNAYLKELKKDRDQALKFKEMNEKITKYRASLLKLQIDSKEKQRQEIQARLEAANKEIEKINGKIKQLKDENASKSQELDRISKEIEEKGEVEQVNLNKEIEAKKIELTKKEYRQNTVKAELSKIDTRKQELTNTIKETENNISSLEEQKKSLGNKLLENEKEKQEVNQKIVHFRKKNNMDDISNLDKTIEEIDGKSENLQKQIHKLREDQHNLIREKDSIQHDINSIDNQIKKVTEIEKEHHNEIEDLRRKRKQFKEMTLELNKRLNEDSSMAVESNTYEEKLRKLKEELAALQARKVSIREASLGDMAIKKILALKKPGIYGTVAELGNVKSKYSLALEIAAGPRLKSIVVEDDKVASECIKYLKSNKLGIATFLPLSKLKPKSTEEDTKKISEARGSHGLAYELVEFEPRFQKVFQYIFANTVVVEDIDVARRLGVGKAKMVTLDGDVAELSGVMTGGFRDKKRKGLGFREKEVSKGIDDFGGQIEETERSISNLDKKRKENQARIDELRKTKAEIEGEIIKREKSLHLEPTELDISKNKKQELELKLKEVDKSIEKVIGEISELNKELAQYKIKKQEIRSKISSLRDPALLAEISTFEEKLGQINSTSVELNSEIKNIGSQISNIHRPEIEKIMSILRQLDAEHAKFGDELKALKLEIKAMKDDLEKKEKQAKIFYAQFKELFSRQTQLNEKMKDNEIEINSEREKSVQTEIKSNTHSLKLSEASAHLSALKQEFQKYEGIKLSTEKNIDQLKHEIGKYEKMKDDVGFVNMRALEIYSDVEKEYNTLLEKKERLTEERKDVVKMMDEIEAKKKDLFMKHFNIITEHFKRAFSALSSKGDAFLELENPDNPFEGGLRIKVKISGMKFMDIRSLSGGEKTMTALAFIFAIQEHEPASFYILDEVDAALDKHNSEKLAKLVAQYSDRAQYIMISHNDSVISSADNLYGVSMNEHGISKVVSLKI